MISGCIARTAHNSMTFLAGRTTRSDDVGAFFRYDNCLARSVSSERVKSGHVSFSTKTIFHIRHPAAVYGQAYVTLADVPACDQISGRAPSTIVKSFPSSVSGIGTDFEFEVPALPGKWTLLFAFRK